MDSAKKGRGRSKSSSTTDTSVLNDTLSSVNGEEAKMPDKQQEESDSSSSKEDKSKHKLMEEGEQKAESGKDKDKATKSRKRKASEMKSSDEDGPVNEASKIPKEKESDTDKSKEGSKDGVDSNDKENVKEADANKESGKENVDGKGEKTSDGAKDTDVEMKSADKDKVDANQSLDQSDYDSSGKQTLGKGKRARIPNKRYSDILLTPGGKPSGINNKSFIENGEKSEKIEAEEASSPAVTSLKSRASTGSPFAKKAKLTVDITNPNYLKPFKYGWKRELVYRATSDSSTKRNGDIYYYTPGGKKVRSMREVGEHLNTSSELKLEDFTFCKEPLGLDDPDKEIIRDAKIKLGFGGGSGSFVKKSLTPKPVKASRPKVSSGTPKTPATPKSPPILVTTPSTSTPKVVPRSKTPAAKVQANARAGASAKVAASPRAVTSPKASASSPVHVSSENSLREPSPTPPTTKTKTPAKLGNFKIKPPAVKKVEKKKSEDSMEGEAGPSSKWSGKKSGKWNNSDSKPCQPCSIRCPAMMGMVPTLQCRLCLCLYHHECVGVPPDFSETQNYVCKNCSIDHVEKEVIIPSPIPSPPPVVPQPLVPPPPLTPINKLKSTPSIKSAALPKLQRIPRPGDVPPLLHPAPVPMTVQTPPEMPRLMPRPVQAKLIKVSEAFPKPMENPKSLVGSVTTWLPQNSKIVDNQSRAFSLNEAPRPQFVEYLAGRKFLIIPKHNIVTVSPTVERPPPVPTSQPEEIVNIPESNRVPDDSASLGMKEACDIKPEPDSPSKPENTQTEAMDVDVDPPTPSFGVTTQDSSCQTVQQPMDVEDTEKESLSKVLPKKKLSARLNSSSLVLADKKTEDSKFMDNYLQHLAYGYNTLLYVFQYLKVQDLLKAGCVCTMWRDVASHPLLWRTVRLKNSTVHSFKGLANTLERHGTAHLDLRKMILPQTAGDSMWTEFNSHIGKVTTLRKIELCRCPAKVIEELALSNPQLEIVNAVAIRCETISVENLSNFTNLKELRLKSVSGFTLTSDLDALKNLKQVRHLSLTSVRDLSKLNLTVIAELTNLETLDLGECMDFPASFGYDVLVKLLKLEKLRLEKGQGNCHTFDILDAIKDMPKLEQLELVNFDIKAGFDKAMGSCTNIKRLLIIPTYISQSATTNHMVLGGVLRLQKTLSHFVWGVTLELLRVTELFVDQCEEPEKKEKKREEKERDKDKKQTTNGDSIPVLKPVPTISDRESDIQPAFDPPQVEILPLPNLQKLLLQSLPTTRVKILKIPFHATWRQSITDSVN